MAHELTTTNSGELVVVGEDGSTLSSLTQRFGHVKNIIDDYGANADGTTDDSSIFTSAHSDLFTNGGVLFVPPAQYLISSTVTLQVPMFGPGGFFNTEKYTSQIVSPTFISDINDGSPILYLPCTDGSHQDDFYFGHFHIDGQTNDNIGLQCGTGTNQHIVRSILEGIMVRRCTVGFYIIGFINQIISCHARHCESGGSGIGFQFDIAHGNDYWVCAEQNDTGVQWVAGEGSKLKGVIEDNGTGLDIVDSDHLIIDGYFENNSTAHMVLGSGSPQVENTEINGLFTSGTITLRNVENIHFNPACKLYPGCVVDFPSSTSASRCRVPVHSRLSNSTLTSPETVQVHANWANQVNVPSENFFINPNFLGGVRGFPEGATLNNVTVAENTTNYKEGQSSLQVTCVNSTNDNYIAILLPDYMLPYFQNRRIWCGGWMYIPSTTNYDAKTHFPGITFQVDESGQGTRTTVDYTSTQYWNVTRWNFTQGYCRITGGALSNAQLRLYTNRTGNNATTNEFVRFGGVFISAGTDLTAMIGGALPFHPAAGSWVGDKIHNTYSAAPSDSDTDWLAGDVIWDDSPSAGGQVGWVCTTAGSPGTWKTFGDIAV